MFPSNFSSCRNSRRLSVYPHSPARKDRLCGRNPYRDLSTAIAGNGLQLEEHDASSERITRDLKLGRSIATQPIWFLAALELNLILHGFLNIGGWRTLRKNLFGGLPFRFWLLKGWATLRSWRSGRPSGRGICFFGCRITSLKTGHYKIEQRR